jgi:hypothetical protein
VPDDSYQEIGDNPITVFRFLKESNIDISEKSDFVLLCYKITFPKIDIRFFEGQEQYLDSYTKCLLKAREDYEFYSFRKDDDWELFLPPPVVGLGIKTKLRPGVSSS